MKNEFYEKIVEAAKVNEFDGISRSHSVRINFGKDLTHMFVVLKNDGVKVGIWVGGGKGGCYGRHEKFNDLVMNKKAEFEKALNRSLYSSHGSKYVFVERGENDTMDNTVAIVMSTLKRIKEVFLPYL